MTSDKKWQIYLQAFPVPIQSKPSEWATEWLATDPRMLVTTGTAESLRLTRALLAKLTGKSAKVGGEDG
jgi:hypothetical protein